MSEPKTAAEELAEELKTLYCKHWKGAYCEICAVIFIKAYAQQVGKAVKKEAIARAQTYQRGGSANLIKCIRAIPVVTP